MSRNRIIYAQEGVYLGVSPASGAHWINADTTFGDTTGDYNLIQPMNRVQQVSYSIDAPHVEVTTLGKKSTVDNFLLNPPVVNLEISYLQNGVFNEIMMGFNTNYTEIIGLNSGIAHNTNNFSQFLLSGFTTRINDRVSNSINWPYKSNDIRNIFVGLETEGNDINLSYASNVHPRAKNIYTIGFGNCYITRYQSQCSVGNFPVATVSYICDNIVAYNSGYNCPLPALSPPSGLPIPTRTFTLPTNYQGNGLLSVVVPGDITINLTQLPKQTNILFFQGTGTTGGLYSNITQLGTDFNDIKIQSYNIDLNLPRRPMENLGYYLPLDRELVYPVYANLSFETIIGDAQTGRLDLLAKQDDDYNITIKLKNPLNNRYQGTAVQYDFRKAKLQNISYRNQIGGQKTAVFDFINELSYENYNQGMFISGLLNVDGNSTIFGLMNA